MFTFQSTSQKIQIGGFKFVDLATHAHPNIQSSLEINILMKLLQ